VTAAAGIGRWGWASGVAFALVLILGPMFLGDYGLTLGFTLCIYASMAQAWNLIGGYGGQFSLGHGMFVGTGAYTVGVLLVHSRLPPAVAVLIGGLTAAVVAATAALPLLRLRAAYFSVGSLGIALAGVSWMINWRYTGATSGLYLPTDALPDAIALYYVAVGLLVVTTASVGLLVRSRFGLRLMAVRDDEDAAAELGVNGFSVKLTAFTISAFFTGLAGGLVSLQKISLEPYSAFSVTWATSMIVMCVVGGLSTLAGPIVGAFVIFGLQQLLLDFLTLSSLMIGVLMIVILLIAPNGLTGALLAVLARLQARRTAGGQLSLATDASSSVAANAVSKERRGVT
jgi:branched-chain amino acid transport system permease protein